MNFLKRACACAAFALLAACGGGNNDTAEPPVVIPPPSVNRAPVADFNLATVVAQGQSVVLDGRASSDPDGDALTLTWQFSNGERAGGAQVAQVFNEPGTYTVRLVATDPGGLQGARERSVTVNAAPAAPLAGTLAVVVTDANGAPLADASVRLASQVVQTDVNGVGRLEGVAVGVPVVVNVRKDGLLEAVLRTRIEAPADGSAAATVLVASLPAEAAARPVDLSAGVDVTDTSAGLRVQVPAGALRRPDGSIATGAATLRITAVAPDADAPFGADTLGRGGASGTTLALASVKVRFEQGGQALDLAPGSAARLNWTVPARTLPDGTELRPGVNLGLHALDTRSGLWREEGQVSVVAGSTADTVQLQASVNHFSYWDARYGTWVFSNIVPFNPTCGARVGALPLGTVCWFRLRLINPRWQSGQPENLRTFQWNNFFYYDESGRWLQRYQVPGDFAGFIEALAYEPGGNLLLRGEQPFAAGQLRGAVNVRLDSRPVSPNTVLLTIDGGNADANGNTSTREDLRLLGGVQSDRLWERVEFTLNGQLLSADLLAPYEHGLLLSAVADGTYTVVARAVRGNSVVESAPRTLRIDRAVPAPSVRYGSGAGVALDGATQLGLASVLRLDFNERMQPASVAAERFTISPAVAGTWALDIEQRIVTFTPATTWAPNTAYTLAVQGALDLAGNELNATLARFATETPAVARNWGAQNTLPGNVNRQITVGQGDRALSFVQPAPGGAYRLFLRNDAQATGLADVGNVSMAATDRARAAVAGDHAVLVWREASGAGTTLNVTRIGLGGATPTWTTDAVATLTQVNDAFDVAVNLSGEVVVAYTVGNLNLQGQVMARRYRAGMWESPTRLDGGRAYLGHLLTAIGGNGDALVTWFDRAASTDTESQFVATRQVAGVWQALQVAAGGFNRFSLDDVRLRGQADGSAVLGFAYTPSNARGSLLAASVFRPGTGSFARTSINDRVVGWDLAVGADGTAHFAYTRTAASNTSAVGRLSTLHVPASGSATAFELASYNATEVQLDNGIRVPSLAVNANGVVMVGGGRAALGRAPFYTGTAGAGFSAIAEATGTYTFGGGGALFLDASGQALYFVGLRFQVYR